MPDPTISTEDMERHGYTDADMPLSKDRAMELAQDITVYLLYGDNTEAGAGRRGNPLPRGVGGITREDWEEVWTLYRRGHREAFSGQSQGRF